MIAKNSFIFLGLGLAYLALAYGIGYWAGGTNAGTISLVTAFGIAFVTGITWYIVYNRKNK